MTDPAVMDAPPATATGPLADLILVRLLPSKNSMGVSKLRADLAPFFRHPPSVDEHTATIAALRSEGMLTAKGQRLTDAGRARTLAYLGMTELPPRANWETVKATLTAKALGLPPDAEAFQTSEKLAAFLLKRKLGLPPGTGATIAAVLDAVICRELGYPDVPTLQALVPVLLGKVAGVEGRLPKKEAGKILPRILLGTKQSGARDYRAAALAGFADAQSTSSAAVVDPIEPFDLEAFANTVKSVSRMCPTGRFGDNKVFISHVWNQLHDEPQFALLGLTGFKQKLIEANRARLLTLSRADMVELQNPDDLDQSETTFLNAVYHFILIEKE